MLVPRSSIPPISRRIALSLGSHKPKITPARAKFTAIVGLFFFGMTMSTGQQDAAALISGELAGADRWRFHLVASPHGSNFAPTVAPTENTLEPAKDQSKATDAADIGIPVPDNGAGNDLVIVPASLTDIEAFPRQRERSEDGPSFPTVNRQGKGDLLISRLKGDILGRAEAPAGTFKRLDGLLLSPKVVPGSQSSFTPPTGDLMIAAHTEQSFTRLASVPEKVIKDKALIPVVYAAFAPEAVNQGWMSESHRMMLALDEAFPLRRIGDRVSLKLKTKKQRECLSRAIYFEARGEPYDGQVAVAQVVMNRVLSEHWPDSVCGVVYQNQHWRNRCQFSFACDRIRDRVSEDHSWQTATSITAKMADGYVMDGIHRSTHYHADYVNPRWARSFNKIEKIGRHIFYRSRTGGWS